MTEIKNFLDLPGGSKHKPKKEKTAHDLFKEYLDYPEFRGPNFTWKAFPEIAARVGTAGLFMSWPSGTTTLFSTKNTNALFDAVNTTYHWYLV